MVRFVILVLCILLASCTNQNDGDQTPRKAISAYSISGKELTPLEESEATIAKKDSLLEVAKYNYKKDIKDLENIIWLGRRNAYLYKYNKAIEIYTDGMKIHPDSPELYRHRGHRYISTRKFDQAIQDFEKAAKLVAGRPIEIEPDGLPNKLNIPLSNLQFNIYYHWGLAYYLKGEFEKAQELYEKCLEYSNNPDLYVATADWLYMTYMRNGEKAKAENLLNTIGPDIEIIENASYLKRLNMYKGILQPEDLLDLNNQDEGAQLDIVTQGYGVGNWYLYNNQPEKAKEIFEKILDCQYWPAFGFLGAEAELEGGNFDISI